MEKFYIYIYIYIYIYNGSLKYDNMIIITHRIAKLFNIGSIMMYKCIVDKKTEILQ